PWKGEKEGEPDIAPERYETLREKEEFILTVCANGYGKVSSAYEYRQIGRGGQGLINIDNIARNGPVVASFPVETGEQLMLVTDQA
ncbi:DNA gyrase C-terminal beta-propeller domain-containing protein, partial [Janibacter hoylei]|uniref:DNA gyrase C-terminal beta-propeller domain-containing protein n=1 Tax=Janibacter hoylei TaxID=364298 RepID=UPI002492FFA5